MKLNLKKPTIQKPEFKFNFSNLFTLASKELKSYFDSPMAYVVMGVFVIIHVIFTFFVYQFFYRNTSDLTPFFSALPYILIFTVPALTMGAFANEQKEGTIEYLLTKPIGTLELLASKIKSVTLFVCVTLLIEFLLFVPVFYFGDFDFGKIFSQILAAILLIKAVSTYGVFVSSITRSQISAYLVTALTLFVVVLFSWQPIAVLFPVSMATLIDRISISSQYNAMLEGAIDMRNFVYFVGFIALFVSLTYYKLLSDRLASDSPKLLNLKVLTLVLTVLIVLATGYGQKIPGRIDFTHNKINSLSTSTKDIVKALPQEVTIDVYYSSDVPVQYQPVKSELFKTLRDYQLIGGQNLKINYKSTDNLIDRNAAEADGIMPIQYQQTDMDSFGIAQFFLGVVIKSGEEKAAIPSLVQVDNLEYAITSSLKKLTTKDKKKIALLSNNVKMQAFGQTSFDSFQILNEYLSNEFAVEPVALEGENKTIKNEDYKALIIPGPNAKFEEDVQNEIRRYFNDGGAILLLVDPMSEELQFGITAAKNENSMANFFEDLGIKINTEEVIYDTKSFEAIRTSREQVLPTPYPFFAVVEGKSSNAAFANISYITMNWAGHIEIDSEKIKNLEFEEILKTSPNAGVSKIENINIDTNQDWNDYLKNDLKSYTVGVSLVEKDDKPGRAVVISDANIISDFSVQGKQNGAFALASIEWLLQDKSLSEIRAKERVAPPLQVDMVTLVAVQFLGPVLLLGGIGLAGVTKFYIRRRKMRQVYVFGE